MIRKIYRKIAKSRSLNQLQVDKDFNPPLSSPYYLIRRGILEGVYEQSQYMKGRLLDFGCGTKPYSKLFPEVTEYIGLDFENAGHPHEQEQIDFFYDGKKIPFTDNSFDAILSTEVFEHIFNIDELLSELYRVLKPGGHMLITCPFVYVEHEIPYDYARYTQFALKYLLEKSGFEVVLLDKKGNLKETIAQQAILGQLNNIKYFGLLKNFEWFRRFYTSFIALCYNIPVITFGKIIPASFHLYTSNIVVARKLAD